MLLISLDGLLGTELAKVKNNPAILPRGISFSIGLYLIKLFKPCCCYSTVHLNQSPYFETFYSHNSTDMLFFAGLRPKFSKQAQAGQF